MIFFFLLLFFSCTPYVKYTPDPVKDIKTWVANFKRQISFTYRFEMKTTTTLIRASGLCVIGRGEHLNGTWISDDTTMDYEYIGLGDVEYSKTSGGQWHKLARGEESNIYAQITRMLNFDKYEYLPTDKTYNYQFRANVPFLAPDRWKELKGVLQVSRKSYLPEFIWAGLPDSTVSWQVLITGYNRHRTIKSPVRAWTDFSVRSDSIRDLEELSKLIKKRLRALAIKNQVVTEDSFIILTAPAQYNQGDFEDMFATDPVYVYGITDEPAQATRVAYLENDTRNPIYLRQLIADRTGIRGARVKFDNISRPFIDIVLRNKILLPVKYCLEINGRIISINTLDKPLKVNNLLFYIEDANFFQMNIYRSSLIQPLPPLVIKELSKGID